MGRRMLVVAVVVLGLASVAVAAPIEGPEFEMRTTPGGEQLVLNDGLMEYAYSGSVKGLNASDLTVNPWSGMVYVRVANNGGKSISGALGLDPTALSTPSSPADARTALVSADPCTDDSSIIPPYDPAKEYEGAVKGTSPRDQELCGGSWRSSLGFNPNWSKGGHAGSLVYGLSGGSTGEFNEFAIQSSVRDWGEMEEGAVGSPIMDAGEFAHWETSKPSGGAAALHGMAYLDRRDGELGEEPKEVDRWVYLSNTQAGERLQLVQHETGVTGADNDTRGTREAERRSVLLDLHDDGILPDTASGKDLAVRPNPDNPPAESFFDVYVLSTDSPEGAGDITRLDALRADIPGTGDTSWELIDLDPDSPNTWVQLKDTVEDADIAGRGIGFSPDGYTLYVSSTLDLDTGHGGSAGTDDARVYLFDVPRPAQPIPEPAGLSLLGLALLGIRRKRRS